MGETVDFLLPRILHTAFRYYESELTRSKIPGPYQFDFFISSGGCHAS